MFCGAGLEEIFFKSERQDGVYIPVPAVATPPS